MRSRTIALALSLGVCTAAPLVRGADAGATLKADADKIDADIQQLQTDQQKVHDLLDPDRKVVDDARKQFQKDADPLEAQLKAAEQKCQDMLKAERDAIKLARDQREAAIHAIEQKLNQDRQRPKTDKSAAAQVAQDEADLKSVRQKLEDDLKPLESKLKDDSKSSDDDLQKQRQAMRDALKPDRDALDKAQKQLDLDSLWQSKVEADRAALEADRTKLAADKQAAGQ